MCLLGYEFYISLLAVERAKLFEFVPGDGTQHFKLCKIELCITHGYIKLYLYCDEINSCIRVDSQVFIIF